jgi:hypothetical protein
MPLCPYFCLYEFTVTAQYPVHIPVLPAFPLFSCTASPYLSRIVLSRTGRLRGLPPIGWLTRCGPHQPVPFCRSGSGLVAPVRARGLAGRGSIGVRTSVRRGLIGRIPDIPTGVLLLGQLGIATQLGIGEKGYELLYSCTHSISYPFTAPGPEFLPGRGQSRLPSRRYTVQSHRLEVGTDICRIVYCCAVFVRMGN